MAKNETCGRHMWLTKLNHLKPRVELFRLQMG